MVIGNGMVARSFAHLQEDPDVIIFASGVSNSQTSVQSAFDRERALIHQYVDQPGLFVYFSTISVLYPCLAESPYVHFKRAIEQDILETFSRAIIFRLPNLVGPTANPHTLTNYLWSAVKSGMPFDIHRQATRYLLDVEHMAILCTRDITQFESNTIRPIALDNKAGIEVFVRIFEDILGKSANFRLVDRGCDISIPTIPPEALERLGIPFTNGPDYNAMVLRKYYSDQI